MEHDMRVATTPASAVSRTDLQALVPSHTMDDSGYFTPSPASETRIGPNSAVSQRESIFDCTPVLSRSLSSAFSGHSGGAVFTKLKTAPDFTSVFKRPYPTAKTFDRLRNNLTETLKWEHRLGAYQSRFVATHPIGALVGLTRVDFLTELGDLQLSGVVSHILGLIGDRDLCAAFGVSRRWRDVCSCDPAARERKERYLEIHSREKENVNEDLDELSTAPKMYAAKGPYSVLDDIQNVFSSRSDDAQNIEGNESVKIELKHYKQFVEVGQRLRPNEMLDKCPRCGSPAKVNGPHKRARCSSAGCEFDYCTLCRCEYNFRHHCSPVRPGSKQGKYPNRKNAKRNLRRLLS